MVLFIFSNPNWWPSSIFQICYSKLLTFFLFTFIYHYLAGMLVFYYLLLVLSPHLIASALTDSQQIEVSFLSFWILFLCFFHFDVRRLFSWWFCPIDCNHLSCFSFSLITLLPFRRHWFVLQCITQKHSSSAFSPIDTLIAAHLTPERTFFLPPSSFIMFWPIVQFFGLYPLFLSNHRAKGQSKPVDDHTHLRPCLCLFHHHDCFFCTVASISDCNRHFFCFAANQLSKCCSIIYQYLSKVFRFVHLLRFLYDYFICHIVHFMLN